MEELDDTLLLPTNIPNPNKYLTYAYNPHTRHSSLLNTQPTIMNEEWTQSKLFECDPDSVTQSDMGLTISSSWRDGTREQHCCKGVNARLDQFNGMRRHGFNFDHEYSCMWSLWDPTSYPMGYIVDPRDPNIYEWYPQHTQSISKTQKHPQSSNAVTR